MFRPKRIWKKQRDKWHMRLLRRLYVSKKFCSLCERARDDDPQPREVAHFVHGSSAALVYETKRFGRRQFFVRVGRWQGMAKGMVLSQYHDAEDLNDVMQVIIDANDFIDEQSTAPRKAHYG